MPRSSFQAVLSRSELITLAGPDNIYFANDGTTDSNTPTTLGHSLFFPLIPTLRGLSASAEG